MGNVGKGEHSGGDGVFRSQREDRLKDWQTARFSGRVPKKQDSL